MNRFTTTSLALGFAAGSLVSCGSMKTTMKKVSTPMKNLAKLNSNDWKMFKLRDLRGDTPPIVQVRPGDLKKMKTSEEHILAWNRSRRSSKYPVGSSDGAFFLPKDFDPSSLPDGDFVATYGILPSLDPGGSPEVEIAEEQGPLPAEVPKAPPSPLPETPEAD